VAWPSMPESNARKSSPTGGPSRALTFAVAASRAEERLVQSALKTVVEALSSLAGPDVEIVLHDLRRPTHSIMAIANGRITGRKVGDPILAGPVDDKAFALLHSLPPDASGRAILAGYRTRTREGAELLSSSAVFFNASGKPYVALCLNRDLTLYQGLDDFVGQVLGIARKAPAERKKKHANIDDMIGGIVHDAIGRAGKPVAAMSRKERVDAIRRMDESGLFVVRGTAPRVARALGVTRYTIYNYLEASRQGT